MHVGELINILGKYPRDLEVELSIVAPPDGEDVEVDRYSVDGVLEWEDEDGGSTVWLVGGETENVDVFLDTIGVDDDEVDDDEVDDE